MRAGGRKGPTGGQAPHHATGAAQRATHGHPMASARRRFEGDHRCLEEGDASCLDKGDGSCLDVGDDSWLDKGDLTRVLCRNM